MAKKQQLATPQGMTVRRVPLGELVPDAANVRTHDEKNLSAITGSLKQFGQVEPLVVQKGTNRVIGGNGRLQAMQALGWTEADVVELELNATQATALGIALNRTGELAAWDFEGLGKLLGALKTDGFDLTELGWAPGEVDNLLSATWAPPATESLDGESAPGAGSESAADVHLTVDQREVFDRAVSRVRALSGDLAIAEGRCLELICADYLSGAAPE